MTKGTQIRHFLLSQSHRQGIPSHREVAAQFQVSDQYAASVLRTLENEIGITLRRKLDNASRIMMRSQEYAARRERLFKAFATSQRVLAACKQASISPGYCTTEVTRLERKNLIACRRLNATNKSCVAVNPQAKVKPDHFQTKQSRPNNRSWWANMDPEERRLRIALMQEARHKKAA